MKKERMCDICKKNHATVHYTKTVNGVSEEYYLCPDCAEKSAVGQEMNISFFPDFSDFGNLFGGLNFSLPSLQKAVHCATCGFGLSDIRSSGRLGCPDCYETFKDELGFSGRRGLYRGRKPGEKKQEEKEEPHSVDSLKKKLSEALKAEDYELCAELRDEIKRIESEGK